LTQGHTLYKTGTPSELDLLFDEKAIRIKVSELADRISNDYRGRRPVIVGVLKGSFMFVADLVRELDVDCLVDFIELESYGRNRNTSGDVILTKDLILNIAGEDVIFVEDIIDSGRTLDYIYNTFRAYDPKSMEVAVLLDKKERREVDVSIRYTGFSAPDRFVVGYGLDFGGKYRDLPYLAALKCESDKKFDA